MVVSINGKGSNKSLEVVTTMQQSNKSLPIQLISKNNYKNEAMNSYFMTSRLHKIRKNVFFKEQTIWLMDKMSITIVESQMIYLLYTLWVLMLLEPKKLPPHMVLLHTIDTLLGVPKTHAHNNNTCDNNNNKFTYTDGTINGHIPHPPTCVWVGWVFL